MRGARPKITRSTIGSTTVKNTIRLKTILASRAAVPSNVVSMSVTMAGCPSGAERRRASHATHTGQPGGPGRERGERAYGLALRRSEVRSTDRSDGAAALRANPQLSHEGFVCAVVA